MASTINSALMKLLRRAEGATSSELLVETFVDAGPLFTLLSSPDHQIAYGRRGTGKTHALIYLRSKLESRETPSRSSTFEPSAPRAASTGTPTPRSASAVPAYWWTCSGRSMTR